MRSPSPLSVPRAWKVRKEAQLPSDKPESSVTAGASMSSIHTIAPPRKFVNEAWLPA